MKRRDFIAAVIGGVAATLMPKTTPAVQKPADMYLNVVCGHDAATGVTFIEDPNCPEGYIYFLSKEDRQLWLLT